MIIVFDFDRTLFDDDAFIQEFVNLFRANGAAEELLLTSYARIKKEGLLWNPFLWSKYIFGDIDETLNKKIKKLLYSSHEYIYSDVNVFLEKNKLQKMILSFGDHDTQTTKIKNSKISHHFNPITITRDELKNDFFISYKPKLDNLVFVDDRAGIIDNIKTKFPDVFCVRMKREGSSYNKEVSKLADYEAKTLFDLDSIL